MSCYWEKKSIHVQFHNSKISQKPENLWTWNLTWSFFIYLRCPFTVIYVGPGQDCSVRSRVVQRTAKTIFIWHFERITYCYTVQVYYKKMVRKSHFEGSKPFLSCMLNAEFFSICIYRGNVLFRLIFWVFKLLIWVLHAYRYGISEYKQFIPLEYTTNVHCFQPTYFLRRK